MRIGIVGGGQLGRMLALAAYPLGHTILCLDNNADAPAGQIAPLIVGDFSDEQALAKLAAGSDVITFDFENVPADSADWLARHTKVLPGAGALRAAQDRILEKSLFRELQIPTPAFAAVDDAISLDAAIAVTGLPAVMKTRRLGYDGKGQRVVRTRKQALEALEQLGGADLILESLVDFQREVSVIAVRSQAGEVLAYPLTENAHRGGILRTSMAPAPSGDALIAVASQHIERLMNHLDYVGVLALELFVRDGSLLANEFAPRVHNSGHWTIEGAATSQFENHVRAISGMPLGHTGMRAGSAAMVNFIGGMPPAGKVLEVTDAHLHDYGKQARPGRKVGHATVIAADSVQLAAGMTALAALADEIQP